MSQTSKSCAQVMWVSLAFLLPLVLGLVAAAVQAALWPGFEYRDMVTRLVVGFGFTAVTAVLVVRALWVGGGQAH